MKWFRHRSSGKQIILKVPDLRCVHCESTVKMALRRVAGVQQVRAGFVQKQTVVTVDPENVPPVQTLTAVLAAQGYRAELAADS